MSGFGAATADVDLGTKKLTGVADPSDDQDAATKKYVDKSSEINSVTEGEEITTISTENSLLSGMILYPSQGTYLVLFNGQVSSVKSFSSDRGNIDVKAIYDKLMATSGGVSHPISFSNMTLFPGVYDVEGAMSISGTLTLDGQGDPSSIFIIRINGAITTGVNTDVVLINQANASNVFWVAEGAISTADPTIMKGTFFTNQAPVALGANTTVEGRMFAVTGALTMGANSSLTMPSDISSVNLGVLSSFAMYTSSGAVSACATCQVTGDVGTGSGAITGFTNITGTINPAGTLADDPHVTSYSIYKNDEEVLYSTRTISASNAIVNLQALFSVTTEDNTIEIRWKVDSGSSITTGRTLSLLRSGQ